MLFNFEQVLCISILQCITFADLKTYIQQKNQEKAASSTWKIQYITES